MQRNWTLTQGTQNYIHQLQFYTVPKNADTPTRTISHPISIIHITPGELTSRCKGTTTTELHII